MKRVVWPVRLCAALVAGSLAQVAWASCSEDLAAQSVRAGKAPTKLEDAGEPVTDVASNQPPIVQLTALGREALRRSSQVGSARQLADAASDDVIETRSGELPRAVFSSTVGPSLQGITGASTSTKVQASGGLNLNGVVYDGGRSKQLTQWRLELANAARFGYQSVREQVVSDAISTALERSRYRQQAQVYQQYARKMSCLVDALTQIVAEDKGRASELLQARKTQMQAELSRDTAAAQGREAEIRLRRLIGDQMPASDAFTVPLAQTLDPGEVLRLMSQNDDLRQLRSQADAAERLAAAAGAATKPQVTWVASAGGTARGSVSTVSVQGGLSVAYTLFDGHASEAAAAAASKRAAAAREQFEEVLSQRTSRSREVHDAAVAAFDRAKRYIEILRDSDRVRSATFQQWSQLGRRSLFDVMAAESDHFNLRLAYVNTLHDGYEANSQLHSLGGGLTDWLGLR